ncbi:serine-type D-Ala-D-Ala carboxypeptidase DacD [Rouxiella sp. Mn2063]|uniref:serine-type D-Ala-D-Ala carboxypeptidase DacD n=1 Tax=Rouxiella sp. Mn2063 TaxID=3395262 RepID=UPI003BCA60C6
MKRTVLSIVTGVLLISAGSAWAVAPLDYQVAPPSIDAASFVLMDYASGDVLAAGNPDERRNPASLTKLMTGYVIDRALDAHKISMDDVVTVPQEAWVAGNKSLAGSSLMFLKPGDRVTVRDLIRGIIIDSGNDACVAMADFVAGNQPTFVQSMNQYVDKLGLTNTHFETVHGLDAPGQYTTSYDLAKLSRAIIGGEPEEYHMYGEKSLTYDNITQQNRNGLLWDQNLHVDGLKTGHTETAGFNIIASATEGNRRLIAVVMGGKSSKGREEQARKLLTWGFREFTSMQVFKAGQSVANEKVWFGDAHQVKVGSQSDVYLNIPQADSDKVKAQYVLTNPQLDAPLQKGQQVGTINIVDGDKTIKTLPLVALEDVPKGGMVSRLVDYVKLKL